MHAPRSLGAFGVTMVLGLFGATGVFRACAPPPPPVSAPVGVTTECVSLINTYRKNAGVAAVTADKKVTIAAESHSTDQAQRNKMTHTGSDGRNAGQRINLMGYNWRTWGENVAAGQPNCSNVMSAWMNSAGHRANILNPAFVHVGVAAVKSSNGTMYWTLDFAAPR